MSTRRDFLLSCSAVAVAASFTPMSTMAAVPVAADLDAISISRWEDQINTEFLLEDVAHAGRRLVLESVERFTGSRAGVALPEGSEHKERCDCFSLLFRVVGPGDDLPQNTYSFRHSRLGRLQVFIVPVGAAADAGRLHEAVFNRQLSPGPITQGIHTLVDPIIS